MNAPQHDPRSVDDDPTGMRALLRGLPDPGPMPADLVARIQASLAEQPHPQHSHAEQPHAAGGGRVVELEGYRSRRTARKGPWLAAAAGLLAVAGGGVIASGGPTSMIAALGGGHSSASGVPASVERSPQDTAASAGSPAQVRVVMTNGAWSGTDLAAAASAALGARGTSAPTVNPSTPSSPALGAIATADGGRDCATALGVPADSTVLIDLGTHDGAPTALVVATTAQGQRTAYLVGRNCRTGHSELRIGPQPLRA